MKDLIPGAVYRIDHARKGLFLAVFVGTEKTADGDPDAYFARVRVPTADTSGQARFANAMARDAGGFKVSPRWSEKLLRPSLVKGVVKIADPPADPARWYLVQGEWKALDG